ARRHRTPRGNARRHHRRRGNVRCRHDRGDRHRRLDAPLHGDAGRCRVTRLAARSVTLAYEGCVVATDLDLEIPDRAITAIVGPNACGKSTLLRALSRLLRPTSGTVVLDGESIHRLPTKQVARKLGLLPQ